MLEEIFKRIDLGEITIDEINSMDISPLKEEFENSSYLDTALDSKIAYYDTLQMSLKISINSLYGALGNEYFPLFNRDVAASITGNGRIYIQGLSRFINEKLSQLFGEDDYRIYNDTDSGYFTLDILVKKMTEKEEMSKSEILNKIVSFNEKYIDKWVGEYTEKFAKDFNCFNPSVIGAKPEKIADKGLFVAKKKYALRAIWDEGSFLVDHPKISVTGLEIVRSSTPKFCRKWLKEVLPVILDEDERAVADFIKEVKKKFMEAPIDDIARVSGIGTLSYVGELGGKYMKVNDDGSPALNINGQPQSAPINVRAALNSNNFSIQKGLNNIFPLITAKDKIKYVFLKTPNIVGDEVIAFFDSRFLEKAGLVDMVDKEHMFDLVFLQPLQLMLDAVEYNINRNFTMELDDWDF